MNISITVLDIFHIGPLLLRNYEEQRYKENGVIFIGRLAEFQYYDMHQVIGSAIATSKCFIKHRK